MYGSARDKINADSDHRYLRMRRVAIVKWRLRLPEPITYGIGFWPCRVAELTENEWGERVIVRLNDIAHL